MEVGFWLRFLSWFYRQMFLMCVLILITLWLRFKILSSFDSLISLTQSHLFQLSWIIVTLFVSTLFNNCKYYSFPWQIMVLDTTNLNTILLILTHKSTIFRDFILNKVKDFTLIDELLSLLSIMFSDKIHDIK